MMRACDKTGKIRGCLEMTFGLPIHQRVETMRLFSLRQSAGLRQRTKNLPADGAAFARLFG
jgi:hypothetical protein